MNGAHARRGLSSVLTSVLMVAVVITIGISVWGYTHSAATVMRSDYYDDVIESVYKIKERFRIENIGVNVTSANTLNVWVVNYGEGEVNITKFKISGGGNETYYYPPDNDLESLPNGEILASGEFRRFDIVQSEIPLLKGHNISVRVESEKENKAYDEIQIP
jgi:flagellin-like protein